ncbi:unnamed protein product [Bathycoccus prasinos]
MGIVQAPCRNHSSAHKPISSGIKCKESIAKWMNTTCKALFQIAFLAKKAFLGFGFEVDTFVINFLPRKSDWARRRPDVQNFQFPGFNAPQAMKNPVWVGTNGCFGHGLPIPKYSPWGTRKAETISSTTSSGFYFKHQKGIAIVGGASPRYRTAFWVAIHCIRRVDPQIPIELWLPDGDESVLSIENLEYLQNNFVWLRNFKEIYSGIKGFELPKNFELKIYALLFSDFKEVLLLDSDNLPISSVEHLFNDTDYIKHVGYLGFGDKEILPAALRFLDIEYSIVKRGPDHVGVFEQGNQWGTRRVYGNTMLQHDPDGHPLFLHSNLGKWSPHVPMKFSDYVFRWSASILHGSRIRQVINARAEVDLELWIYSLIKEKACFFDDASKPRFWYEKLGIGPFLEGMFICEVPYRNTNLEVFRQFHDDENV